MTAPHDAPALAGLADSHCHLNAAAFDRDRAAVIARAQAVGVETMIVVGLDPESSERAMSLARLHDGAGLAATAGLHPHEAGRFDGEIRESLEELCARGECCAVGETGLDWFKDWAPRTDQLEAFRWQLALARRLDKPVVIHSRDAHEDTLRLVEEAKGVRGVMHCFSYGPAEMELYLDAGLSISFSGNVTYRTADSIRAAAASCPADRLLVETDAPYLAPLPHRRERAEPAHVASTLRRVAEARGEDPAALAARAGENTRRLFGLSTAK